MAKKVEVVVEEISKENTNLEKSQVKKSVSWKRIGLGLAIVLVGNIYSYFTAYSKGLFLDYNTVIGLLAIIIGLYLILK